jgi:hypothetical protein
VHRACRYDGPSWCEASIPLEPPLYAAAFEMYATEGATRRQLKQLLKSVNASD